MAWVPQTNRPASGSKLPPPLKYVSGTQPQWLLPEESLSLRVKAHQPFLSAPETKVEWKLWPTNQLVSPPRCSTPTCLAALPASGESKTGALALARGQRWARCPVPELVSVN